MGGERVTDLGERAQPVAKVVRGGVVESVHHGHVVALDAAGSVVLSVGDYTARVGDPSGRSSTRPQLSGDEIDRNAKTYQEQALKILDPERTELRLPPLDTSNKSEATIRLWREVHSPKNRLEVRVRAQGIEDGIGVDPQQLRVAALDGLQPPDQPRLLV